MRSVPVELKLVVSLLVLALVAGAGAAAVSRRISRRGAEAAATQVLRGTRDAFEQQERSELEKLSATLHALLANDELRDAFAARDRARLLALARPLFETMRDRDRITHWYFLEPEPARTVFLRVHRPELLGDRVDRATLTRAIETRDLGTGKELGQTAFALRAVHPWIVQGRVIGYLELAEEFDDFLAALKARTGDEYGFVVKKRFLDAAAWTQVFGSRASSWDARPDTAVLDATAFPGGLVDFDGDLEALPDEGRALDEVEHGDRASLRGLLPVRDAAGRPVGALFVLHDFSAQHAMRSGSGQGVAPFVALFLGFAVVTAALVHALVFARLERLRRRIEAREVGSGPVRLGSTDALGRLEASLARLALPGPPRAEWPLGAPGRGGEEPAERPSSSDP